MPKPKTITEMMDTPDEELWAALREEGSKTQIFVSLANMPDEVNRRANSRATEKMIDLTGSIRDLTEDMADATRGTKRLTSHLYLLTALMMGAAIFSLGTAVAAFCRVDSI